MDGGFEVAIDWIVYVNVDPAIWHVDSGGYCIRPEMAAQVMTVGRREQRHAAGRVVIACYVRMKADSRLIIASV